MSTVNAVSSFHCSNCDGPVVEVFNGSAANNQFVDALEIQVHVGYGMLFDHDLDKPNYVSVIVCKDCALGLIFTIPALRNAAEQFLGDRLHEVLLGL